MQSFVRLILFFSLGFSALVSPFAGAQGTASAPKPLHYQKPVLPLPATPRKPVSKDRKYITRTITTTTRKGVTTRYTQHTSIRIKQTSAALKKIIASHTATRFVTPQPIPKTKSITIPFQPETGVIHPQYGGPSTTIVNAQDFGSAAIAGQAVVKTITYTPPAGGTSLTFSLAAGINFKLQSGACTATECTATVAFTPTYPGSLADALNLFDSNNNLIDQTFLSGVGTGPLFAFQFGDTEQDGELASQPAGAAFGPDGTYYVVDQVSQTVIGVGTDGEFSTIPIPGLCNPAGIAVDGSGTIYIADPTFNRVLSISAQGLESVVPTSPLLNPSWLAVDGSGALYISDTGNNRIIKLDNQNKETTILSELNAPSGIAVDAAGDLFYADAGSNGEIKELQATGETVSIEPDLGAVIDIALDASGRVYYTTSETAGIINPATGEITNVQSDFEEPFYAIAVSSDGRILTTGLGAGEILITSPSNGELDFFETEETPINSTATSTLPLVNIGNSPLTLSSVTTAAPFSVDPSTQCSPDTALAAGATCNLQLDFTPTEGILYNGTITATGNSLNTPGSQITQQLLGIGQGADTQTTLTVSPLNANVGDTVSFTSVVTQLGNTGLPAPTGSVSIYAYQQLPNGDISNFQPVGTATIATGSTTAVLTSNQLPAATYQYIALYTGDDFNSGSESGGVVGTVGIGSETLGKALSGSASTLALNQPFTLTLNVQGEDDGPTGQVIFYEDDEQINTANLVTSGPNGTATLTINGLSGGDHTFVAGYIGDVNYGPFLSNEVDVSVTPGTSSTALVINPTAATTTQEVAITANVTSGTNPAEGGDVLFSDQNGAMGLVAISPTSTGGTATFTTLLTLGSHQITAKYEFDGSYTDSTSPVKTIVITPGGPLLDLTISAANINLGQTEILTLILGAGEQPPETGTVTFSDQNGVLGTATVCACTPLAAASLAISTLGTGVHNITATYSGDKNYSAGTSSSKTVTVGAVTSVAPTTTTLNVSAAAITVGQSETLTATVSTTATTVPSGMVTFSDQDGALGTVALVAGANGAQATLAISTLSVGSHQITAVYAGSASFATSTSQAQLVTVSLAAQTITFPAIPNHFVGDAPFMLTATASSGLPVTYTVVSGPATVAGSTVSLTGTSGTVVIQASQAGDTTYAAAMPVTQNFNVSVAVVFALTSITPNAGALGSPATTITLTGTDFSTSDIVQLNGATITSTYVSPTSLTAIIPATFFSKAGTGQVTVHDTEADVTTAALPFTVSNTPQIAITGPSTAPSGAQPKLTITLANPYPVPLTVNLSLTFAPATTTGIDDPAVQFSAGGRALSFDIPANSTATPTVQIQTGTVAGTATIDLTVTANGVGVTPVNLAPVIIVIPPAAPTITSMSLTRSGDTLTVAIVGFSNTREALKATFNFTPVTGSDITDPAANLDVTSSFTTWYNTTGSDAYGSAFTYTQIFTLDKDATIVESVKATLANTIGTSAPATAQ